MLKFKGKIFAAITFSVASFATLGTETHAIDTSKYPKLKAGDWEMTVTMAQLPMGMRSIYCVDDATQDKMLSVSQQQANCEEPIVKQTGNTYFSEVTCSSGGVKMHSKGETTLIGDTELRIKATVTMTGQPPTTVNSTAKFLGACSGGRKPGDMALLGPDGKVISTGNLEQIQKMGQQYNQGIK